MWLQKKLDHLEKAGDGTKDVRHQIKRGEG